jgi:hypothetical protein
VFPIIVTSLDSTDNKHGVYSKYIILTRAFKINFARRNKTTLGPWDKLRLLSKLRI